MIIIKLTHDETIGGVRFTTLIVETDYGKFVVVKKGNRWLVLDVLEGVQVPIHYIPHPDFIEISDVVNEVVLSRTSEENETRELLIVTGWKAEEVDDAVRSVTT